MDRRSRGGRPRRPSRPPPPRRQRPKNRPRRRPPSVAVKLVVRRLPPTLSADEFAKAADPRGADRAISRSYMPGCVENTGAVKRTAHVVRHSVAYLGFEKAEQAAAFHDAFNTYKFVDTAKTASGSLQTGSEYYARVERALYQTVPPLQRRNPHPLTGTIESDTDFQRFLKSLEGELRERSVSLGQTSAMFASASDAKRPAKDVVTPLMEDVRAKRKERDDRKKSKSTPRSGRKGRPVVEQNTPEPVGKTVSRKKKRRGPENANSPKREETPQPQRKPPTKGDRRNGTVSRRDEDTRPANAHANGSPNAQISAKNPSFVSTGATQPNGSSSNAKTPARNTSRPRYGRGPRGKGKSSPGRQMPPGSAPGRAPQHVARHSQDSVHGPVRLLKKEASATSAT